MKTLSIKKALVAGFFLIISPSLCFLFGLPALAQFIFQLSKGMVLGAFVLGVGLAVLWSSFWTIKWRLWAFKRVEDKLQLLAKSEANYLISPPGSSYEKFEIKGKKEAQEWQAILDQIKTTPVDLSQPVSVYFSSLQVYAQLVAVAIFLVWAIAAFIYMGIDSWVFWAAIGMLVLLGLLAKGLIVWDTSMPLHTSWDRLKDKGAQLSLDNQGISIRQGHIGQIPWEQVDRVRLHVEDKEKFLHLYVRLRESDQEEWRHEMINIPMMPLKGSGEYLRELIQAKIRQHTSSTS